MDLAHKTIERNRYNLLEAFGEIGGFFALLQLFFSIWLGMNLYNDVENYLVSRLFRVLKKQPGFAGKIGRQSTLAQSGVTVDAKQVWGSAAFMSRKNLLGIK